ncbi:hypothetical protein GE107_05245 [Cohnella sp. CFH 77786]|uniref:hypothetical protein n=1 Tax=Cohnella sp. CFH 77786 TaxID=2662265 RepID=UPI001C6089FF|nr:hypothetical protein [Cohnella sp. CFH 77786]MBW5445466.1 hypothetical protein [Cohnella sp. CFH 77786]
MKKLLVSLFVFLILITAAGAYGLYYIRPDPMLSLDYESVPLKDKALDMVKRRSLVLVLSEDDVNNVLKRSLADNPRRYPDVEVRGARFALSGDRLVSDLSLMWKDRIPTSMQVTYRLGWQAPNLTATVESVKIKDIRLPEDTVDNLTLPLGEELPKPLKIKKVTFGDGEIRFEFRKPSLSDLKELAGSF